MHFGPRGANIRDDTEETSQQGSSSTPRNGDIGGGSEGSEGAGRGADAEAAERNCAAGRTGAVGEAEEMTTSHGSVAKRTWIYQGQKRSAFAYCFTYTDAAGKTQPARGQADTRDGAHQAMIARKAELAATPAAPTATAVTLAEYADKWLMQTKATVAQRTHKNYTWSIKSHVLPTLGAKPLAEITRGDVVRLLKREACGRPREEHRPAHPRGLLGATGRRGRRGSHHRQRRPQGGQRPEDCRQRERRRPPREDQGSRPRPARHAADGRAA